MLRNRRAFMWKGTRRRRERYHQSFGEGEGRHGPWVKRKRKSWVKRQRSTARGKRCQRPAVSSQRKESLKAEMEEVSRQRSTVNRLERLGRLGAFQSSTTSHLQYPEVSARNFRGAKRRGARFEESQSRRSEGLTKKRDWDTRRSLRQAPFLRLLTKARPPSSEAPFVFTPKVSSLLHRLRPLKIPSPLLFG